MFLQLQFCGVVMLGLGPCFVDIEPHAEITMIESLELRGVLRPPFRGITVDACAGGALSWVSHDDAPSARSMYRLA